ncbi:hypothetical protein [Sinosporangium siamense]|uniref:Uncharacterized protein n=1 Tax=Sinosporangium siamense TaxID=1367973 RepID=A0A919RI23_9ACTN|nr:hypothetical protein [Sinosporangium siamense]GII94162.1 hypothetical protein Ssi02_43930 [Sinosporangium siamense]
MDCQELANLIRGRPFLVGRVRLPGARFDMECGRTGVPVAIRQERLE